MINKNRRKDSNQRGSKVWSQKLSLPSRNCHDMLYNMSVPINTASVRVCSSREIGEVSAKAASAPRLRAQHEFHASFQDPIQRFLNAIEPGSYVRPHRHLDKDRWEWFQIVAGAAGVLIFDDKGKVLERVEIRPEGPVYGVEILPGCWHTVVSLAPGTVLFEMKQGPFVPLTDKDFAHWAPPEGDAHCHQFASWFGTAAVDDFPPESWRR